MFEMPPTAATSRLNKSGSRTPRTARGERTRLRLVEAAVRVFLRDGYFDATMAEISLEAGVASKLVYHYFEDKADIFDAVVASVKEEMVHPHLESTDDVRDDPVARIEAANRTFLLAYKRNARLLRLIEGVAALDANVHEIRRVHGDIYVEHNAQSIRELQALGLADPDLDPLITARALSAMVRGVASATYVDPEAHSLDELVATLTQLWTNALRLPQESPKPASGKAKRVLAETRTPA